MSEWRLRVESRTALQWANHIKIPSFVTSLVLQSGSENRMQGQTEQECFVFTKLCLQFPYLTMNSGVYHISAWKLPATLIEALHLGSTYEAILQ